MISNKNKQAISKALANIDGNKIDKADISKSRFSALKKHGIAIENDGVITIDRPRARKLLNDWPVS
ncbi:hypothetical protein [Carboxylicivirga sp. RSCT41]|uniref:hypothetical protein n=1 Tax=Carboxylicivirga agarovorans TaxID=3417570 RepID=UPI003D33D87A